MRSEKFERQIQNKLEEVHMAPSPGLWSAIAEQLPPPKPKKRGAIWWWTGGSSLLAAALVWAWLAYRPGPAPTIEDLAPNIAQQAEPESAIPAPVPSLERDLSVENTTNTPADHSTSSSLFAANNPPEATQVSSDPTPQIIAAETTEEQEVISFSSETNIPLDPASTYPIEALQTKSTALTLDHSAVASVEVPELPGRWSVWTVFQPEWADRGNPLASGQADGSDHALVEQNRFGIGSEFPSQAYILQYPRQSVTVGALLSYQVNPRWAVQMGALMMLSETGSLRRGDIDPTLLVAGPVRAEDAVRTFDLELSWRQSALEIPVRAHYLMARKGRHSLNVLGGVSLNRALQVFRWNGTALVDGQEQETIPSEVYADQTQTIQTEAQQELLRFRNWHAHLEGRLLYGCQLSQQLGLFMGPSMKYHLLGSYAGLAARDQMRYRLGLEVGVRFGGSV